MMNKVVILVIDGCAPEYITPEFAPNIHRLARLYGFAKTVKAVVPTVTNVSMRRSCQGNSLRKPAWRAIIITIRSRAKKVLLKKKVS